MPPTELKVSRIGNSRGVRLPAVVLRRYQIGATVIMEEHSDGILLRPNRQAETKLSWDETALAMAAAGENWSEWDVTLGDGLAAIPWYAPAMRRVAEAKREYLPRRKAKR
jgi:antitoxin MazE